MEPEYFENHRTDETKNPNHSGKGRDSIHAFVVATLQKWFAMLSGFAIINAWRQIPAFLQQKISKPYEGDNV